MKKSIPKFCLSFFIACYLAGCGLAAPTMQPTRIEQSATSQVISRTPTLTITSEVISITPTLSPTPIEQNTTSKVISPTSTLLPTPEPSMTPTPLDTLEPEIAKETLTTLLREPVDCSAPCFFGITPGLSTAEEVITIFDHLGLQPKIIVHDDADNYNYHYALESGLSIGVLLPIEDNVVRTITIDLEFSIVKKKQEWSAYSPDTLIKRYGMPSQVNIVANWSPSTFFVMDMYFDQVDLIVEYIGQYAGDVMIPIQKNKFRVCPLTAPFEGARLWMGKDPRYPPNGGISLEMVTALTLDKFARLMTGDPEQACFIFDKIAYDNASP